jgi:hypothetical protein
MFQRTAHRALVVALGLASVGHAEANETTVHVMVDPGRLSQCGDKFYATGGSDTYRMVRILADGKPLGEYDLVRQPDCTKVLDYFADLPANGKATITVEVGGYAMDAPIAAADRNRVYTVKFFVDAVFGELTQDNAPSRQVAAAPAGDGTHANTINIRVAPNRQWQCGDNFFSTGGKVGYEFADIAVDGVPLTTYDLANPRDCARVETVVKALPDGGKSVVAVRVGGSTMTADIAARDRERGYWVNFFVDQAWGEVIGEGQ